MVVPSRVKSGLVSAGFGGIVGALVSAIPLSLVSAAWPTVLDAKAAHVHQGPSAVETALAKALPHTLHHWAIHRGYLPWQSIPALWPHAGLADTWLVLTAISALLVGWKARGKKRAVWGGPTAAGKGQHGTAHWRSQHELRQGFVRWKASRTLSSEALAALPSGLVVGVDGQKAWVLDRDEHALILGSTRSGKTRRIIIPTIGVIGTQAQESLVMTDPKAELYDMSAAWLKSCGYHVIRLDLIEPGPGHSRRFNPVQAVAEALHQTPPDYAQAATIARQIGHTITHGSGSLTSAEPIWVNGQISLTAALVLAIAEAAPPEARHLGSVYQTLVSSHEEDDEGSLDAFFAQFPANHPASLAYGAVKLSQSKTRASILVSTAAGLQLWADREIAWLTGTQDHDLAEIGRKPTAVFLVIPHDEASKYMVAGLYVTQLLRALTHEARKTAGRLPIRVNLLLDEFGNMPPFPDFDQFVTVAAGMGIRITMALQNLEQLKKHYAKTERTIRGNAGTWCFLRTSDLQTAEELSKIVGKYTTLTQNHSRPTIPLLSLATANIGSASESDGLMARSLVTPDELLRWPQDTVMTWQAGFSPARLPLPDLSQWKHWPELQHRHPFTPDPVPEGTPGVNEVPVWSPAPVWPEDHETDHEDEFPGMMP